MWSFSILLLVGVVTLSAFVEANKDLTEGNVNAQQGTTGLTKFLGVDVEIDDVLEKKKMPFWKYPLKGYYIVRRFFKKREWRKLISKNQGKDPQQTFETIAKKLAEKAKKDGKKLKLKTLDKIAKMVGAKFNSAAWRKNKVSPS